MARLAGKTAVILGAASRGNIAQTIAQRFADEGAKVLVSGRHEEPLAEFAGTIGGEWALCDITRRDAVFALAKAAREKLGSVDIAINATGWGLLKPLLDVTEEELDRIVDLQFKGVHHFLQAFVTQMMENEPSGGSIIQISSATTRALLNDHAAYIGTKTGSEALIRCVANDFGKYGIRANTISPAFTESPMTEGAFATPGMVDAFLPQYPLGRLNTAADVANAALWLASDEAFLTGQNVQPNGGLTLRRNPLADEIGAAVAAAMERQD
ncbi:SDR family oxidoreductase [Parasphingopyxis algicola]|uniref:SDR family NAD(P)-dependent oxidoreductase n=1 Tax=Parasphingopyxis algicola TaxID=2026624 RepID=UPI0015A4D483|nr:SDR family oxidoreductase [Parasphingopyxis algicola]QLC25390.1 SDR family oxidoreductase [Parasphingopyxis algicola]